MTRRGAALKVDREERMERRGRLDRKRRWDPSCGLPAGRRGRTGSGDQEPKRKKKRKANRMVLV